MTQAWGGWCRSWSSACRSACLPPAEEEIEEESGFDETETLQEDDLVILEQADGTRLELVLLAVVESDGATYALLTPRDEDDESELMVATYHEDEDGTAHFGPVDDDSVLVGLEDVVRQLAPYQDDDEA